MLDIIVDQNPKFGRLSPPRPSTLMLDNGQTMDLDTDYRDSENNFTNTTTNMPRNRKKKKRAADIPVKKFNGKPVSVVIVRVASY